MYNGTEEPLEESSQNGLRRASSSQTISSTYMNASTATVNIPRVPRSVLYQLKSFGNETNVNPLQLPSNIQIVMVANSASHFLAVTLGIQFTFDGYFLCYCCYFICRWVSIFMG